MAVALAGGLAAAVAVMSAGEEEEGAERMVG